MYDPNLHLFITDDEILYKQDLPRMVQTLRRDRAEPVFRANGQDEGTAIGYSSVTRDEATGEYTLWYMVHEDGLIRRAVSKDGWEWTRKGTVLSPEQCARSDNLGIVPVGKCVDSYFKNAKHAGFIYFAGSSGPFEAGIYMVRSKDGKTLEVRQPGILPGVGDRSSLTYDPIMDEYLLISRPCNYLAGFKSGEAVTKPRLAYLWKSKNLVDWPAQGVAVGFDDLDPVDVQIYGMQIFRYGRGFLALVEIYHQVIERLDLQLAWSEDGVHWRRVGNREPVFTYGGEGAWDSHWVVSTYNSPIPDGDRFRVYYTASGTKHASGLRHRRHIGLASIRKDGWVSLEAGRTEGKVVTTPLPLDRPMKLELNVNAFSGYVSAEIYSTVPGKMNEPVAGYESDKSKTEKIDAVSHRVAWAGRDVIQPIEGGRCHLRLNLYQGSLFSYHWSPAE